VIAFYEMRSNFKEIYIYVVIHDVFKINLTQIIFYFQKLIYLSV
jgi:hypothetical protein